MSTENDKHRNWLRKKLEDAGRGSKQELAKYLGFSRPDAITRMLNTDPSKESRDIKASELEKMRAFFGETQSSLTGPTIVRSGDPVSFAGIVQAGEFRAVDEYFNQDPEQVPVFVLPDPQYSRVRQYAWRACGDSMNQANIHDGMWVVGADFMDYVDQYGDIVTGDFVVVERTRSQGAERELTVKEVHFFKDRYELRPVSDNPDHLPIIVQHDHSTDNGTEVKMIAVVLTAYANLKQRR